jgi:hypothetical protein
MDLYWLWNVKFGLMDIGYFRYLFPYIMLYSTPSSHRLGLFPLCHFTPIRRGLV